MAKTKTGTVKVQHSNGTTVRVRKDKVELLERMGFTKPTASRSTSKKKSDPAPEPQGLATKTVEELKDEIRTRNEGREEDATLPLTGTKDELIAALEADDESD